MLSTGATTVAMAGADGAGVSPSAFPPPDRRLSQFGPVDDARFPPGRIFASRYRIVSLLGRGAMGEVYRADDLRLGKVVAVKLLATQAAPSSDLHRFISEVRLAREIAHPNVCRVYDIGQAEGWHYLSMEYVDGETLASLLRRIGRMPREKALDITRQLCAGLAAAHEVGILHRDIKPSNIMLDGRGRVRLMDFGLAVQSVESVAGELAGTAAYMAPEQLAGDRATERTDLYALGLVLYELFTGHRLFAVRSIDERIVAGYNTPIPDEVFRDVDPIVARVIRWCLQHDPAARPVAAGAVASALPGGDQLTAAVVQGRLLEPELIAAAGEKVRWHPAVAWSLFGATMIILLGVAARIGTITQIQASSLPKPTEVLVERAREILILANHQGRRVDTAAWFVPELISNPSAPQSNAPVRRFRFTYRQSPTYLVPLGLLRTVSDLDPAPDVPGMASVTLDASGRLIRFVAVPQGSKPAAIPAETDWTSLFSAAGLNLHEFDVAESEGIPSVAHDHDVAWRRRGGGGTGPAVAAATMNGTPVYFEIRGESPFDSSRRALSPGRPPAAEAFFWAMIVLLFVAAALMARYNLRREAGDRGGARKLGTFVIVGGLITSLFQAHHTPSATDEFVLLLSLAGWTLVWASLFWLIYMALEPGVRQLWPHTLITWTRLMSGRVRDPLVGRDLLVGVAIGVTLVALRFAFSNEPLPNSLLWPALESLRSARHFLAMIALSLLEAPEYALAGLFFILIVRALVRNTLVAVVLVAVLTLPIVSAGTAQDSLALTLYALFLGLVGAAVVLRLGLLTWTAALLVLFSLTRLPITLDTSAWYYESSLVTLLLISALAAYGCLVLVQPASHRPITNTLPT